MIKNLRMENIQGGIEYITGGSFKGLYENWISPCLTPIEEFVGITREDTLTAIDIAAFSKNSFSNLKNSLESMKLYNVKNLRPTPQKTQVPAKDALIGYSRQQVRRNAERIIRETEGHPLKFLLNKQGKFKGTRGVKHHDLCDRPDLIQMGHVMSNKLGGEEFIVIQNAWENQFSSKL